jgi:hypothetical protein
MGNFALQKGPYSFLNLRISPWGVPFPILLCSFSLSALSSPGALPFSPHQCCLFLYLSLLFPFLSPAQAVAADGGSRRWVARAERRAARQAQAWASARGRRQAAGPGGACAGEQRREARGAGEPERAGGERSTAQARERGLEHGRWRAPSERAAHRSRSWATGQRWHAGSSEQALARTCEPRGGFRW